MTSEITVTAPPGRLGIHLHDDSTDPNFNTIITQVSLDSPLVQTVFPGDRMVEINGVHVQNFDAMEIFNLLQDEFSYEKVIVVARNDGNNLEDHPNHHSFGHRNNEGHHHRVEEHEQKCSIVHDSIGHGGQEAHCKSRAINAGEVHSRQVLHQSHTSHSIHPESYDTTIETGVHDTEARILELQHKEDPRKRWWKSTPQILVIITFGALLVVAGIVTGTVLQQQSKKSSVSDISAGEEVGGHAPSEVSSPNAPKTIYGASSAGSKNMTSNITSNEETYDMDNPNDIESTNTFLFDLVTVSQDQAPANDECSSATVLSFLGDPVQTINGSTLGATQDGNMCDTNFNATGVWYLFRGEGKLVSITFAGYGWVYLVRGLCSGLTCVHSGEDAEIFAESGIEYRILVQDDHVSSDFTLIVEQVEPPENSACDSALAVESLPFSFTGNMKGARKREYCDGYYLCSVSYFAGVWFTFIGTGTPIQVDLTEFENSNLQYEKYAMEVHTDGCPPFASDIEDSDSIYYWGLSKVIQTEFGLTYHLYVAVNDIGYKNLPYYITIKM